MAISSEPRVCVVILNWNNYAATQQCLMALEQASYANLGVFLVDNGSQDGSRERLAIEFPRVHHISNRGNVGFSRGCNVGIRTALRDPSCAYILLLNNDAIVTPGCLQKPVEAAESSVSIGLVGGKVLQSLETRRISYAGGHIDRVRGTQVVRGFDETDCGQYDRACDVGFVTGALMLIRREVLENVGLLPEEYFFGTEEADYSLAVMRAGYRLRYVPEFLVIHSGDGSHSNYDPKFVYNSYRNKLILQEKFLPGGLFGIWKQAFRWYGKHMARRAMQRLADRHGYDRERVIRWQDLDFALMQAIEDHGKDALCYETLMGFEALLQARGNREWREARLPEAPAGQDGTAIRPE